MKTYAVEVTGYIPYPMPREYVETVTSMPTAIARAVRKYRKDDRIKCKRITHLFIKVGIPSMK